VHTQRTVADEYADRFDGADPPCRYRGNEFDDGFDYSSFRDVIIDEMTEWSLRHVSHQDWRPPCAECDRICGLIDQQPPLWDGCRTIDYTLTTNRGPYRLVILHGEEEGDDLAVSIIMAKPKPWGNGSASIYLYTTEAPQPGGSGPAAFPRAVAIAHNKMGDAVRLLPNI